MASRGGVEIEEVAAKDPREILRETVDPSSASSRSRRAGSPSRSGSAGKLFRDGVRFMQALFRAFVETDCSLAEINPLVVTKDGELLALDAKMGFDDNALFRHPDIRELRDLDGGGPARGRGVEVRPQLHQARRQHRLHGERRRPGDGDDGPASSWPAASPPTSSTSGAAPNEEKVEERVPDHPLRPEREGDLHQHLRRHHALRRDRQGGRRRRSARWASRFRSSCAWRGRTSTRGSGSSRSPGLAVTPAEGLADAAQKAVEAAAGGAR